MNADDDAPTLLREVARDRVASDPARTKLYRPTTGRCVPRAGAPARDTDPADTAPRSRAVSAPSAQQAQTVVRPLHTRAPRATPAPRSRARELALRCALAVAVSAMALGASLAFTGAAPTGEPERPPGPAPQTSTAAENVARRTGTPPRRAETTDRRAPSAAPVPVPTMAGNAVTAEADAPITPVATPAEAVRLLAAGAYAPALDAYGALARGAPDEPVYAVIARVLERNLGARCDRSQTPGDATCSTHDSTNIPFSPR